VADGVGVGDCAAAGVDDKAAQWVSARTAASMNGAAMPLLSREGRNKQRMNAFPEKGA
jgi:hypothetical protein